MKNQSMKNHTVVERTSDRALTVTRTVNGPARLVFEAWSTPALFQRWWMPKSCGITVVSCEMDIRTGGGYRLVLKHPAMEQPMTFFGSYIEVTPGVRMVWTNEESPDGAVTTVTFTERGGVTEVVLCDLYPSKEVLDAAIASGSTSGFPEQFEQLDEVLATLGAG